MITENSIMFFKNGYIDRCKNINSLDYMNSSFVIIENEHELIDKLKNGYFPIFNSSSDYYKINNKYKNLNKEIINRLNQY